MEFWIIICKLVLLVYLALTYIHSTITNIPWVVFSFLLYLCINVAIYIVKIDIGKKIVLILSIVQLAVTYIEVQTLFLLLLPLSLCEFSAYYIDKKITLFVLVLLPILWIDNSIAFQYGLVAVFSFVIYTMLVQFTTRIHYQENQLDLMRKDMQKLSKSFNENNEFIRQSEYTFKLEERNRLAQVFHDKIGHSMTGALIQMEASKRLMNTDKDKAQELLQNAINISKVGIENIRITLKNLKPPTEQMGINRLKLFIDDFSARHPIHTPFIYKGNIERITPIQWKIIHENLTETMTNALKYSEATVISIELHVLNTMVKVVIKDDGKGVQKIKKGLGIVGMEERTASINGTIIVDGTEGFSVTMLLPIQ
ncbi:sensor histidine kinase [Neobacillus ginsengisoli]|uniref:histidine kinase n=1 Tax=Neobacillus ginsengisoli TaxID=904295 RepID=A0ABT9XUC6_9BACI|nr:histidine kinase [Neobacillus ginsengisoli]MDQ0198946.1 signal transduction histidine kinase [Neobacillus ginsengisoli]